MKLKLFVSTILLSLFTTMNEVALAQTATDSSNVPMTTQETEKINNIKQLLKITGSSSLSRQIVIQTVSSIKSQYPQVPQKFWDTFLAEVNTDDVVQQLIPIYSKYYSDEDIKGLITFYQTPLGKKTIMLLPQLSQESIVVGQKYGIDAAKRAIQKLEAEGYLGR
ncbi:MAG: DUF2059 domain-containing protein [Rhizonema sp. PD38]|nr:DUF2059 domain-containing protein [Rhizonema sp. PD38]